MENLFTPGKIFLFFCAALIAVWSSLQLVINLRLTSMAKLDGQRVLDWSWPAEKMRAKAEILGAEVVSRSATDAVVKVKARQTIQHLDSGAATFKDTTQPTDCQAVLTYYKTNRNWFLGKVEMW